MKISHYVTHPSRKSSIIIEKQPQTVFGIYELYIPIIIKEKIAARDIKRTSKTAVLKRFLHSINTFFTMPKTTIQLHYSN